LFLTKKGKIYKKQIYLLLSLRKDDKNQVMVRGLKIKMDNKKN